MIVVAIIEARFQMICLLLMTCCQSTIDRVGSTYMLGQAVKMEERDFQVATVRTSCIMLSFCTIGIKI